MTIRVLFLCYLCSRPYDVPVNLFGGAELGSPKFYCRDCTRPRIFRQRLQQRLADDEARFAGGDGDILRQLIATELAVEEDRAERLAA